LKGWKVRAYSIQQRMDTGILECRFYRGRSGSETNGCPTHGRGEVACCNGLFVREELAESVVALCKRFDHSRWFLVDDFAQLGPGFSSVSTLTRHEVSWLDYPQRGTHFLKPSLHTASISTRSKTHQKTRLGSERHLNGGSVDLELETW
jgi:hypothetical protein